MHEPDIFAIVEFIAVVLCSLRTCLDTVDFILWRKAHLSTREFIWRIYSVASVFYFNITSTKWDVVADGACARVKVSAGCCASTIVRWSIDTCRVYKDC